jgi:hypothetical protein
MRTRRISWMALQFACGVLTLYLCFSSQSSFSQPKGNEAYREMSPSEAASLVSDAIKNGRVPFSGIGPVSFDIPKPNKAMAAGIRLARNDYILLAKVSTNATEVLEIGNLPQLLPEAKTTYNPSDFAHFFPCAILYFSADFEIVNFRVFDYDPNTTTHWKIGEKKLRGGRWYVLNVNSLGVSFGNEKLAAAEKPIELGKDFPPSLILRSPVEMGMQRESSNVWIRLAGIMMLLRPLVRA